MIRLSDVSMIYKAGNKALQDVSFTVEAGGFVFIVGRSGSGKSTLLKLLLKELEPSSGQILVNGVDLGDMPRRHIPRYRRTLGLSLIHI